MSIPFSVDGHWIDDHIYTRGHNSQVLDLDNKFPARRLAYTSKLDKTYVPFCASPRFANLPFFHITERGPGCLSEPGKSNAPRPNHHTVAGSLCRVYEPSGCVNRVQDFHPHFSPYRSPGSDKPSITNIQRSTSSLDLQKYCYSLVRISHIPPISSLQIPNYKHP